MKRAIFNLVVLVGLAACGRLPSGPLTGTVERVWEDGFSIRTGDRTVNVDAWDVCGDSTRQNVSGGDELTVEGEFSGREFDASSITNAAGENVCS